ncbi:phage tail spike protein [Alkalicoccobacillus gibsonii]|uniref:phage tail spike protein n=1 Tax=Alkalicoccobacillus gibsonii TaxID=79881 RepID=UPI00351790BC
MKNTNLFIFADQSDQLLAILSNKENDSQVYYDDLITEQLNKDFTFEFSVPMEHEDSKYLVEGNRVVFLDAEGEYQEFKIYKTEEENTETDAHIFVSAEHSSYELLDDIVTDMRVRDGEVKVAMERALSASRWKVGHVGELGTGTVNFYYSNAMKNIKRVQEVYGGELKFRIVLNENKTAIKDRFVDLPIRRGEDTGARYEYRKDLVSVKRISDRSGIKTALYGQGQGEETENNGFTRKPTFADVVWSKKNGDPVDKPKGQTWVGDPEALKRFGRDNGTRHLFGTFEVDSTEPKDVLAATYEQLMLVNQPSLTFEVTANGVEIVGLDRKKVSLGDTLHIIDKTFTPELRISARVIEIKRSLSNPLSLELVLGNYIPMLSDEGVELDELKSKIIEREGVWNKIEDIAMEDLIKDITPTVPTNFEVEGLFQTVQISWDYDPYAYHLAAYEVYGSTTKDFYPDDSYLLFKGLTGGFAHAVNTNEVWYYRIRAVAHHGRVSPYSEQLEAATVRIQSTDVFFGEAIAEELRKLSEVADILGEGSVHADSIRKDVYDQLERESRKYSQEEIAEVERALLAELEDKVGMEYINGRFEVAQGNLNKVIGSVNKMEDLAADLVKKAEANAEQLAENEGKLVTISSDVDEVKGEVKASIEQLKSVEGKVSNQSTEIDANAKAIKTKADSTTVDKVSGDIENVKGELSVQAGQIQAKAEKSEVKNVDGKVTKLENKSSELSVAVDGIRTNVQSVKATVGDNLLPDGDFENEAMGWDKSNAHTVTFPKDSPNGGNSKSARFQGRSGTQRLQYEMSVKNGNTYRITYWVKTSPNANGNTDNQKFRIGRLRDNAHIRSHGWNGSRVEWEKRSFTWTAPADLDRATISLSVNHTNGWVQYSEVEMVDITEIRNLGTSIEQLDDKITLKAEKSEVKQVDGRVTDVRNSVSSLSVGVDKISQSVSSVESEVEKRVSLTGIPTSNTGASNGGKWTKFARTTLRSRYHQVYASIELNGGNHGSASGDYASLYIRHKQQNEMGQSTIVDFSVRDVKGGINVSDFQAVLVQNSSGQVIVDYYVRVRQNYNMYSMILFNLYEQSGSSFDLLRAQGYVSSLPNGTKYNGSSSDTLLGRVSSSETKITQTEKEINLRATKTEVNSLTGRMSKSESSISQMSSNINLKVNKDDIVSQINLSPGTVKIDARMLEVGDFTNLVDNGTFENDKSGSLPKGWYIDKNGLSMKVVNHSGWNSTNGSKMVMQINSNASDNNDILQERVIQVTEGEELYIEGVFRNSDNTGRNNKLQFGFRIYDGEMNHMGWRGAAETTTKTYTWTKLSGVYKVQKDVQFIRVWVCLQKHSNSHEAYVDNLVVRRRANADMIVDGAITANKMAANSITAGNGAIANAAIERGHLKNAIIGEAQIANSAITRAKIANASIDNAKIANSTITNAKIANISASKITTGTLDAARVMVRAMSGRKAVQIDEDGFKAFDSNARMRIFIGVNNYRGAGSDPAMVRFLDPNQNNMGYIGANINDTFSIYSSAYMHVEAKDYFTVHSAQVRFAMNRDSGRNYWKFGSDTGSGNLNASMFTNFNNYGLIGLSSWWLWASYIYHVNYRELHQKSSREIKENINPVNQDRYSKVFDKLDFVTFNYKHQDNGDDPTSNHTSSSLRPNIGLIYEDSPKEVVSDSSKSIVTSDVVSVIGIKVKQQDEIIKELQREIKQLKGEK